MRRHFARYPLLQTALGRVLASLTRHVDGETCVEIGCGSGQNGQLFGDYLGVDYPHILDEVASVCMPDQQYMDADILFGDLDELSHHDVVLMSAFLDVCEDPADMLRKVIPHCRKYVIIHRQDFSRKPTHAVLNPSHGLKTWHSIFNIDEFFEIMNEFDVIEQTELDVDGWVNGYSYLFKRK